MGTTAELVIPASEFALARTLDEIGSLDVSVEPVVATDPGQLMPYVRFRGPTAEIERVDEIIADDPTVTRATLLANSEEESRYRIQWDDSVTETVRVLTGENASILGASASDAHWHLRVLVPERDELSRTYETATEAGITVDLARVHEIETDERSRYGLTDAQYETLVEALVNGYYEIPRTVDMEALAEHLDISHQALSERLRRAHRRLVTEALDVERDVEEFE
ncbi:helix-turn-helix domain-containing protein [Halovivax gelatinilyticus]|uniref:helix-turn-helix domain-containing protein n=1 Tax=Halovivax gelatinilyticus TaxID=2961597 RepID=UPI0020CA2763|nr:helix-turn-helix domain-containing protein [Halovivax gelatinilyticus]